MIPYHLTIDSAVRACVAANEDGIEDTEGVYKRQAAHQPKRFITPRCRQARTEASIDVEIPLRDWRMREKKNRSGRKGQAVETDRGERFPSIARTRRMRSRSRIACCAGALDNGLVCAGRKWKFTEQKIGA